jgi:Domain of unknown function (DUF4232)
MVARWGEEVGARSPKMSQMRTKIISSAVLAIAAATVLAGCGGSSPTSSSQAASSQSTTEASQTSTTQSSSATSTAASVTTTASTAAGPPVCRAAGMELTFLGGQGATGHGELGFALKNTQSTSCNTVGYPGIQFLSRSGAPLPTTPSHTTSDFFGSTTLTQLVVAPGQTASFRLGTSHGSGSSAGCVTAYGLQVIPPNDTGTLHVSIPGGAAACGTTTVSPMQAGTSAFH